MRKTVEVVEGISESFADDMREGDPPEIVELPEMTVNVAKENRNKLN